MTLPSVLAINGGSSSVKFAVYGADEDNRAVCSGAVERVGDRTAVMRHSVPGADPRRETANAPDHGAAVERVIDQLRRAELLPRVVAVGHRLVHGGSRYREPVRLTSAVRAALDELVALAPEHLPYELRAIDAVSRAVPHLPQVACFDTAFHHDMPEVARWYGLPRHLVEGGVTRYGFHGLSYEYVTEELRSAAALGRRTIVAHLGNGASMVALRDGRSVDTSMGLTPSGGFVMGTRSGDLDPGVVLHLLRGRGLTVAQVAEVVNATGGLLGISGTSAHMRDLLARSAADPRAADAVSVFCYQVKKFLGAYVAALGGLDTLVFTGGIGENAPLVRERICDSLECFGIALEPDRNDASAPVISTDGAPVTVRVVTTNEELMIARHTWRVLTSPPRGE